MIANSKNFVIRQASLNDMDFILELAEQEGWNPGLHDAASFFTADPHGFFIGELEGKKIGSISAVAYDEYFGFLGLYIVLPEYRGQGFGMQLWKRALAYLGERTVGLDGVVAQQENYKRSHFVLAYKNSRYQAPIHSFSTSSTLVDLTDVPFHILVEYDEAIFGFSRVAFLKSWISAPRAFCFAKIENEKLLGYGIIRPCVQGYKIGPLFADSPAIAEELYQTLSSKVSDGPLFLDVPEINTSAIHLVTKYAMKKVFETARMYRKLPPQQLLEKVYGVTTFELG
ncbi:MAG: gCN5-related N-acetyltransferase [Chlamydiia bacterium]|nr:gCN5-related N-acetyltransferase [Chlamydiia bacterium]